MIPHYHDGWGPHHHPGGDVPHHHGPRRNLAPVWAHLWPLYLLAGLVCAGAYIETYQVAADCSNPLVNFVASNQCQTWTIVHELSIAGVVAAVIGLIAAACGFFAWLGRR